MKYIAWYLIVLAGFLTGCSQSHNPAQDSSTTLAAQTSTLVEFGTLKLTDGTKLMTATIYNDTGASLAGPATLSSSDFAFFSGFNCPGGAKPKTSCPALKLSFNPSGKSPGEFNATINLGSITIPIHATIEAPPTVTPESLAAAISSSLGDNIDFGSLLSSGNTIIKTIVLTNGSAQTLNLPIDTAGLSPFSLVYDTCSNKNVLAGKNCQLKIALSPATLSGNQAAAFSYAGHVINLLASVITPESVAQSGIPVVIGGIPYSANIQFLVNNLATSTYVIPSDSSTFNVIIKNSGNLATPVSTATLSGTGASILYNGCTNKVLTPNSSCSVKILTNSPAVVTSLSFTTASLALTRSEPIASGPALSLVANFAYSQSNGGATACKVKGPFGQDMLMADLVIEQGVFTPEEEAQIQSSACDYLTNSFGESFDFRDINQCSIPYNLSQQLQFSLGYPYFYFQSFVYFDFSAYSTVSVTGPFDCDNYLTYSSPTFTLEGGDINLTDGVMRFPIWYNNNLYYGVKGPGSTYYWLTKSNGNNSVAIISTDYKVNLDTRSPMIVFDGKLFFIAQYQQETQYKLFYLDESDVIHEFLGQIPGAGSQGIRDNNTLRMTAAGNYLLLNREIDRAHILKVSSYNGPVVDMFNSNFNLDFLAGSQGEVIGNYYLPTAYNINNNSLYLASVDLVNSTISSVEDSTNLESGIGALKQKSTYPLAKTNGGTKIWTIIIDPAGDKIVEYSPLTSSKTVHTITGSGIGYRTFSPTVTYFSTSIGGTFYLYKISDDGLQFVDSKNNTDYQAGFISNDGSLVYTETNPYNVVKINYNQPKTIVLANKVFYQEYYAYTNQNLRDHFSNPVFKNKIVLAMADYNPATLNIESNFKMVLVDLTTLTITNTFDICPGEVGAYDLRPEPTALLVTPNALFLSIRTCGTSDYQLYKYSE